MAYDKVVDSAQLDAGLSAVANAIREKTGSSESIVFPGGFVASILGITTGGSSGGSVSGEMHDVIIEADLQSAEQMLLFRNEFVSANYLKTGFMAMLFQKEAAAVSTNRLASVVQGNLNLGASTDKTYGYVNKGSFSTVTCSLIKKTINEEMDGSTTRFRTDDVGTMYVYAASGNILNAGSYKLVLLCFDI